MRILITGGAGFIGQHLMRALLSSDNEVATLDVKPAALDTKPRPDSVQLERYSHYVCDVTNFNELELVFGDFRPTHVYHLASRIGIRQSVADPVEDARINVLGTVNVLQACQERPVCEGFTFASSMSIYGSQVNNMPLSPYAAAKKAAEAFVQLPTWCFPTRAVRLTNIYGPGQLNGENGAIGIFCDRILRGEEIEVYGTGAQRDFVFIDDAVRELIWERVRDETKERSVSHVATGEVHSILDIALRLGELCEKPVKLILKPSRQGDISVPFPYKAPSGGPGWTSLASGLEKTVKWHKERLAGTAADGHPAKALPSKVEWPVPLDGEEV